MKINAKVLREMALGVVIIAIFAWLVTFIYRYESRKSNRELAQKIAELSPRGGPPETIDGLRQAIAIYEDQIERNVREGAQTGVYWKILATRLADRSLHNDALYALERAIYYNSEDPLLFYLTGVSAGFVAKSKIGFSESARDEADFYYALAENGYLRALELDITYDRAMYGLAVLYVFELDRPSEAIVYLERYLSMRQSDISAMFVLARAYYMTENFHQAVEIYDRIVSRTRDARLIEEAINNRETIQRMIYE